jgi:hypothetical protein
MRSLQACILLGMAAAAVMPSSQAQPQQAQPPGDWFETCLRKLDPQTDIGYERIVARCPELPRRLADSGWTAWMPRDWQSPGNDLSAASLRELRASVTRELATRSVIPQLSLDTLRPILAELGEQDRKRESPWHRFQAWLRELLDQRDNESSDGWVARSLSRLAQSDGLARVISWICLAFVVVMAIGVVLNELRVAGIFRRVRAARTGRDSRDVPRTEPRVLQWSDVQGARIEDRPRLLLELIVSRLVAQGKLPPADGLTVRELVRSAALGNGPDGELLMEVALAAERIRYSGGQASDDSILQILERGRRLLGHIEAGALPPRGRIA